jgi:lipid II:glycine glycyltransferase (peptidoglycan interpeptide bridge formation enzyme)
MSEDVAQTSIINLLLPETELLRRMHPKSCRYMVRRAEKLGERVTVRSNDANARKDFIDIYNRFVDHKGFGVRTITWARMAKFEGLYDVFVAYIDSKPLSVQLVLRDRDEGWAMDMMSANEEPDGDESRTLIGLANRYLHWHIQRFYKQSGFALYDFGGIDPEKLPSITSFKLSFGGDVVTIYNYVITGSLARVAISLRELSHELLQRVGIERRVWQV